MKRYSKTVLSLVLGQTLTVTSNAGGAFWHIAAGLMAETTGGNVVDVNFYTWRGIALPKGVKPEIKKMPPDHIMKIGPTFFPSRLSILLIVFSAILAAYKRAGAFRDAWEAALD